MGRTPRSRRSLLGERWGRSRRRGVARRGRSSRAARGDRHRRSPCSADRARSASRAAVHVGRSRLRQRRPLLRPAIARVGRGDLRATWGEETGNVLGSAWWAPADLDADGTAASPELHRCDAACDRRDRGCAMSATNDGKLWGGRFAGGPSPELEALSRSTHFDWRLARYDIAGSHAHAKALAAAGLLTEAEEAELHRGLDVLSDGIAAGTVSPDPSDEDVHGALERLLIEEIGADVGGKLRAGRSRNDQIATLFRCYLLDHSLTVGGLLLDLVDALAGQAEDASRRGHARAHSPPARAAGPALAPPARPRVGAGARRRPACRLEAPGRVRLALRLRRTSRPEPGSRPRAGGPRAQLHRVDRELHRRDGVSRLRLRVRVRVPPRPASTSAGSRRRSSCGRRGSSGS